MYSSKDPKFHARKQALKSLMNHMKGMAKDKLKPKADQDLVAESSKEQPEHNKLVDKKEQRNLGEYGELNGLFGIHKEKASEVPLDVNSPEEQALPPEETEDLHKQKMKKIIKEYK